MSIQHKNYVFPFAEDGSGKDLAAYRASGGFGAFQQALAMRPEAVVGEITASGLRGRGGAAFPTGQKIAMVAGNPPGRRFIICNADEGEPGTFKDRFILTHSPFQLLEGLLIAGFAAGASEGYIYIRHEYPEAQAIIRSAIKDGYAAGLLGDKILGQDFSFDLRVFSGAGSYLCGEETALLSSIEGKKGRPRVKPPYPTQAGLWGFPTLINNVETLANIPAIISQGAAWYRTMGTNDSPGTKLISLSGDVVRRGLYEVPFGTTFREIIDVYGGGPLPGHKIKAVNIGGASGVVVPVSELDTTLEYGACNQNGITIGSGAIFVLDETRSIVANVRNRVEFFLHESCGKCTPCREGLRQAAKIMLRLSTGSAGLADVENLERYTRAMQEASFCGLGQAAGNGLISSLKYFRAEFEAACEQEGKGASA